MLTPDEQGRLQAHRQRVRDTPLDGQFFVDISKVEEYWRARRWTPTLLQSSKIWREALRREALPIEHLVFQGFPALPMPGVEDVPCAAIVQSPAGGISEAEIRSLSGNAMHLGVLGAVFLYTLCAVELIEEPMRFHRMRSLLELPVSEDPPPERPLADSPVFAPPAAGLATSHRGGAVVATGSVDNT